MGTVKSMQLSRSAVWEVSRAVQDVRDIVLAHYDREHIALRGYLLFLGMDLDSTREIVQESFLKLHEHLLANGNRSNLRAWVYRVAHNLARNAQTASYSKRTELVPDLTALGEAAASLASAEDELLARERLVRVRQAMTHLSTAQRECLVLRSQGLKYREIAEVLSLSVSTVAENIQRGLGRVKELL